jgi:hypothetical protein
MLIQTKLLAEFVSPQNSSAFEISLAKKTGPYLDKK